EVEPDEQPGEDTVTAGKTDKKIDEESSRRVIETILSAVDSIEESHSATDYAQLLQGKNDQIQKMGFESNPYRGEFEGWTQDEIRGVMYALGDRDLLQASRGETDIQVKKRGKKFIAGDISPNELGLPVDLFPEDKLGTKDTGFSHDVPGESVARESEEVSVEKQQASDGSPRRLVMLLLKAVDEINQKMGATGYARVLTASSMRKLAEQDLQDHSLVGVLEDWTHKPIRELIYALGDTGLLEAQKGGYNVRLTELANRVLDGTVSIEETAFSYEQVPDRELPDLTNALQDDVEDTAGSSDSGVSVRRIVEMGESGDPGHVEQLSEWLQSGNVPVRRAAATALGKLEDPGAVDALIEAVSDDDNHVRRYATEALGKIG
ncbi:MAG: RQC domain-containing protein, partial [bacterium]